MGHATDFRVNFRYWTGNQAFQADSLSVSSYYPGPGGFSWIFFAKEINSKPRSGDNESRKRRGEREKPLVTLVANLTFMQTTGSGSDPQALIGWYFFNTHTNLIGSFNCNYRRDVEDFHTSFGLSLPGKKIVCHYEPQGRFSCTHEKGSLISMEIPTNWTQAILNFHGDTHKLDSSNYKALVLTHFLAHLRCTH